MNKLQLHLIAFFFRAFLPRKEVDEDGTEEDATFYSALGVSPKATPDDIRKAYRKKSLQHHPDKVAQFARSQDKTPEQIQADFVKIKEAYETLSDESKRNAYDVLGEEGGKMISSFVDSKNDKSGTGGGFEFHKLVYNLARASLGDKCKLFSMVALAVLVLLIGPILICAKVDATESPTKMNAKGLEAISWLAILTPVWILNLLFTLLCILGQAWFSTIRMLCIIALEILLALNWDGTIDVKYELVLIPLFLHQAFHLIENMAIILKTKRDVTRMVTMRYVEKYIIPTFNSTDDQNSQGEHGARRSYEDLTDEEREEISHAYIIITEEPQEDDDESVTSMQAEVQLMLAIARSPEFEYASLIRSIAKHNIRSSVMFRVPFLILLVLQLDGNRGWDWNIVFTPIWVEVLFQTLSSCWSACCGAILFGRKEEDEMEIVEIDMDDSVQVENEDVIHDVEANQETKTLLTTDAEKGKATSESRDEIQNSNIEVIPNEDIPEGESSNTTNVGNIIHDTPNPVIPVVPAVRVPNSSPADNDDDMEPPDSHSAEEHAMAVASCCNYSMIIIGLSLFVVKLNHATDMEGSMGYSSYWVLFPMYLIAALVLMMFGCIIFATPAMSNADRDDVDQEIPDVKSDVDDNEADIENAINQSLAIEVHSSDHANLLKTDNQEDETKLDMDDLD